MPGVGKPENGSNRFVGMVRGGADSGVRDRHGNTALIAAAAADDIKAVRALIRSGADANAENARGETALMMAAANGDTELVGALLGAGAHAGTRDASGGTALMRAANDGNAEVVGALIKAGADVNAIDDFGRSALSIAVIAGNFEAAAALIVGGASLPEGWAQRHVNDVTLVRGAIEFESNTDLRSAMTRVFDAFVASCESRMPEYSIEVKDYEFLDADNKIMLGVSLYSPMEYADVRKVPYEKISMAMTPECGISFSCEVRITPGGHAGASETYRVLGRVSKSSGGLTVSAKVEPKLTIKFYDRRADATRLLSAVAVGDTKLVGKLLSDGADVNAKDKKRNSALVWAAMMARLGVAKLLLARGADARDALATLARLNFPDGVRFLTELPKGKR